MIIDLTHTITPEMPVYPGTVPPVLESAGTLANRGWRETRLAISSHSGTHMDAPAHILADGSTLDQLPPSQFYGRAVALDELAGERLILREPGSGTRAIFEEALHRQNYPLDSFPSVVTISDFSTIKSLVADGLGLSFLYAPVVEQELEAGTLARFDLAEVPMSGAFYFVCLKDNLFAKNWMDWMQ